MAVLNRPGSVVTLIQTPPTPSVPTDSGIAFVIGLSDRGPLFPVQINSLSEFVSIFGDRQTYSLLYDWLDVYFREGGNKAWISRVVGPAATTGSLNLLDSGAAISLVVSAIGPGAWSSSYKIQVAAGVGSGTFVIRVLDASNNVLEDSGDLLTQTAAVQWATRSAYIRLALGASANNPAVLAATALSAGNDDRANATDTQYQAAWARFIKDLGPGQCASPGRTTDTAHSLIIAHAQATNRVAVLDLPDSATVATLQASAAAARDKGAAVFAPWITVPGVASGPFRVVPPSALICGLCGRNDPTYGANHPAAGRFGFSNFAYDLSQVAWDDPTVTTLTLSGVNVIRRYQGTIQVFGWRSTSTDTNWLDFGNGRLYMAIAARLDADAQNFEFAEIDGQEGSTINEFHSALAGTMMDFYSTGQLFGDTAPEAFVVDTGPGVNTLQTIANQELHAVVAVRMATMAEFVQISIAKVPVTQSL